MFITGIAVHEVLLPSARAILTAAPSKENVSKENEANRQERDEELNNTTWTFS